MQSLALLSWICATAMLGLPALWPSSPSAVRPGTGRPFGSLALGTWMLAGLRIGDAISLSTAAKERRKSRDKEVIASVKRNVVGCKIEYVVARNDPSEAPAGVKVHLFNPSRADEAYFDSLPVTLSQSNANLSAHATKYKYTTERWGSQTHIRWAIPMDHPGQHRKMCVNMTLLASTGRMISFYEEYRQRQRGFYLMNAVRAFIHPSGAVMLPCGHVVGDEGCETRKVRYTERWVQSCRSRLAASQLHWDTIFAPVSESQSYAGVTAACADLSMLGTPGNNSFSVVRHERVFTVAVLWDYNYHHFLVESLGRLVHSLPFLRKHPDVKVHIRSFEEYDANHAESFGFKESSRQMRRQLMDLLGISPSRLVWGPVLADIVFMPKFVRCSYALSNAHQMLSLGKELVVSAYRKLLEQMLTSVPFGAPSLPEDASLFPSIEELRLEYALLKDSWRSVTDRRRPIHKERLLIVQQRFNATSASRYWNDQDALLVKDAFATRFPSHRVVILSSKREARRTLAEDLYLYSIADVLVGLHGAGMTNMLVMAPNALVVEMTGAFVDVSMPVCGYYGPLAAALGHHHMLYSYDWLEEPVPAAAAAQQAAIFYAALHRGSGQAATLKALPALHP